MTTILADTNPTVSDMGVPAQSPGLAPASAPVPEAVLAVAATFTSETLEEPLRFLLQQASLPFDVQFAAYNQVFQELLTPQSLLARNASGINVLLIRLEDFLRDSNESDAASLLARTVRELGDAVEQFARRSPAVLIISLFSPSPSAKASITSTLVEATRAFADVVRCVKGVLLIGTPEVDRLCDSVRYDEIADRLAHIPFTEAYFAALAIAVTRRVHTARVPAHKVLVLDCDNTIWQGVVGEDGPQGITLDAAALAVQRFAVDVQAQGALVCLASKNVEADVMEVFSTRSDMVLTSQHLVSHRINWEAKASNLRSLARELNLGLDSFVFIDDNPVETGAMRELAPEVVTLQLPVGGDVEGFLANLWTFDKATVTQEDARRTDMYRENSARDSFEAQAGDIGEFLAALQLKITISAPADSEWPRLAQLTQRTNQFNFTTRRRTEAELRAVSATAGAVVLAVHVSDRFGDYGLVGLVVAHVRASELEADTFLLSCRVLGRGVEHSMVTHLGALAVQHALGTVRLRFAPTPKNEPARAFADSILANHKVATPTGHDYVVPSDVAAAVTHRAGEDAEEVIAARRADGAKPAKAAAAAPADRSDRYMRLATGLASAGAVLHAMRTQNVRRRTLAATASPPRSATERSLVALWEEILGMPSLGIDDDFFALGGSSLQAARMFAEIAHRRGAKLPLTTIIESPTVRALANKVDSVGDASDGGLVPLKIGGGRKLFLIHDGDGETLLYRNLAQRASPDISVFGIQPARLKGIPLAHRSIEDMAAAYVRIVRDEQAVGPYLLGGMCAGGLIAYEMAQQLERAGEAVEHVLMLDTATPQAQRRVLSISTARASRLQQALHESRTGRKGLMVPLVAGRVIAHKVFSVVSYKVFHVSRGWSERLRLRLLNHTLATNKAWPAFIPSLDFRAIYNDAERRYCPAANAQTPALLVRARDDAEGDEPYIRVFQDPTLGWQSVAGKLTVADTAGGHASMLQEPHAASLADVLRPYINAASGSHG